LLKHVPDSLKRQAALDSRGGWMRDHLACLARWRLLALTLSAAAPGCHARVADLGAQPSVSDFVPMPKELVLDDSPFGPASIDDRDEDCMSDAAEQRVASFFSPMLIFDSRENAMLPGEPVVIYRVSTALTRPSCHVPAALELTFASLFADDGGYVASFFCNDRHPGDNETIKMQVQVADGGRLFRLTSIDLGGFAWPTAAVRFYDDHHPIVYMSAGKHHKYFDTSFDGAPSRYSAWRCTEGVDGLGARILTKLEHDRAPRRWTNVGEPGAHPDDTFVVDLTPLGFPFEQAWSPRPFCGGHIGCGGGASSNAAIFGAKR
jgi:hypothetical protein